MGIQTQTEGRRTYILGNTYPVRDQIRALGAHWDAARKAWWTAKADEAVKLVERLSAAPASAAAAQSEPRREAPGMSATVAGRATYQGRTYYVAGRIERGRTHWDNRVRAVTSRDGAKVLLYFRDGSSQFWADGSAVQVDKRYDRPQTIQRLHDYAQEAKTHGTDECHCSCHREPGAGRPGTTLYDGCDRCGCEAC